MGTRHNIRVVNAARSGFVHCLRQCPGNVDDAQHGPDRSDLEHHDDICLRLHHYLVQTRHFNNVKAGMGRTYNHYYDCMTVAVVIIAMIVAVVIIAAPLGDPVGLLTTT